MPTSKARPILLLLFLVSVFSASFAQTGDFVVVLFPDTQNEAQYYPQVLASQTKWVAANRSALNIQVVLGLGDIVNDGASTSQQQNADAAIKVLDNAKVPYLLSIGNHDYDGANTGASTRTATGFNTWWGPQRYAGYSWYKGNLNGSNENFYGELTIGGETYLFLILEYVPRSSSLSWAASIVSANPDKEVIVVTHSNMFYDNTRVDQCDTNDLNRDNDGDETWANFTSKYPNISMVVSGHITTGLAARRADLGVNGNLVNQMLSNYQVLSNGGDGWMRILTFHPSTNTVDVKTYSPYLNAYKTDSKNQFTINWHNPNVTTGSSTITGRVSTPRSSTGCTIISGAQVSAGGVSTTTDSNGRYSLTLAPGAYSLTVSASGYATQSQTVKAWDGYGPDVNFYMTTGSTSSSVTLSPTSLTFASQNVGTTSASQSTTLKNGTTSTLSISGISATGDFAQSNNCGSSLAAGASCTIAVTFTPTTTGTRTGTLTVSDSAGTQTASLSGTGGTTSSGGSCTPAGTSPSVTICTPSNNATVSSPVQVTAAATDTNPVKYLQIYLDGVRVYEVPASSLSTSLSMSAGTHRLTVQAADSTGLIFKTTIYITVSSGGATGSVTVSPTSLTFPSQNVGTTSAAQAIALKNGTSSTVSISGISTSGDFAQSNNCGSSLATGASCSIAVTFTPTTTGARTGTLTVSDSGGTQTASLSGTGGTASSGGSCTPTGTSPSVTICTPSNNATVSSPVQVSAAATDTNAVKYLQIYLDGVKVYEVLASSLNTSLSMSTGTHRLTVQAADSTGLVFKTTINITVQ